MNTEHLTTTAHDWKPLERFLQELALDGLGPSRRADLTRVHRWLVRHQIPLRHAACSRQVADPPPQGSRKAEATLEGIPL